MAAFYGCAEGPEFARPYGDPETEERVLGSFSSLKVGQRFQVYLLNDTSRPESISIRYGSNLLEGVETNIESGELEIRDKNNFNWVRNYRHYPVCTLNVHKLNRISLDGAARLECMDSLKTDKLEMTVNSVEDQLIRVHCGQLYGSCSNSGRVRFLGQGTIFAWTSEDGSGLNASGLRCDDAYIFHYTDLDVTVNPRNLLEAHAYGNGNIFYRQTPAIVLKKFEFGRGRVIQQ